MRNQNQTKNEQAKEYGFVSEIQKMHRTHNLSLGTVRRETGRMSIFMGYPYGISPVQKRLMLRAMGRKGLPDNGISL